MSQTYIDPRDKSTLRVESMTSSVLKEPLLRFVGHESPDYTTVDLDRESVKALVKQATKWLEDTEVKLPTIPGSHVVAKTDFGTSTHLFLDAYQMWQSPSGAKWSPPEVSARWVETIHDAGQNA